MSLDNIKKPYRAHRDLNRLSPQDMYMKVAYCFSERSTCARRKVGAVLVDSNFQMLSGGYNGVPSGMTHCIDSPCEGAHAKSGTNLDMCSAIHAEQNAILQCRTTQLIHSIFTTTFPCMHCIKILANTPAIHLYFAEFYTGWEEATRFWMQSRKNREGFLIETP